MNVEHFYCYGSFGQDPDHPQRPYVDEEKVSAFLNNLKPETTDIIVHIRSKGGSYDIGFNCYDLLVASGKNIETIVEGECHSIATIPLLAGAKRGILPSSRVGIHNPWISGKGIDGLQSKRVLEIGSDMLVAENKMCDFYAAHTGTDRDTIKQYMDEDKPFDAATALELKFVTYIVETKPTKVFAYLSPKHQTQNTMSNEIKTLGQKLDAKLDAISKAMSDFKAGITKTFEIKGEGEIKAESFVTSEGTTINIDGGLVVGAAVTDEAGAPVADASITLENGTSITTDAAGLILTVTEKAADPAQDAIDMAVASATKAMQKEIDDLKAEKAEYIKAQVETNKRIDLLAKNIQSDFNLKTGDTKFTTKAAKKDDGAITKDDIAAVKKKMAEARAAKQN